MRNVSVFLGAVFFSLIAFTASYSGAGKWKSNKGEAGEYTVEATLEAQGDEELLISQTLSFDDSRTLSFAFLLRKIDDTFYEVVNSEDGTQVGQGYCWELEAEKVCSSSGEHDGYRVESTVHITATEIFRVGSKTNLATQEKITWLDKLELQDNE